MRTTSRRAGTDFQVAPSDERIVWPWIEAGKINIPIDATFPLAEAAKAHAHLEAGAHVGKVVLTAG